MSPSARRTTWPSLRSMAGNTIIAARGNPRCGAAQSLRSDERALGYMGDAACEVGFAAGDDEVIAGVSDAGGEDHVTHVHLVFQRARKLRIGFDQRPVAGRQHLPR